MSAADLVDPWGPDPPWQSDPCKQCGGKVAVAENRKLRDYCSNRCRYAAAGKRKRGAAPGARAVPQSGSGQLVDALRDASAESVAGAVQVNPIKHRERTERQKRADLLRSPWKFITTYFGHWPMPFHRVLVEGLLAGGMREYLLPTEHAKTTYGAVIFPVLSTAIDMDARHIVGATNLREAEMRVKAVKAFIEANPHGVLDDYPWLRRMPGRPWTQRELWFQGASTTVGNINPSLAALGRGARDIKGRRAKTVFDDLEGMNESLTQLERDRLWNWLTLEAIRVIEDPEFFERPLLALLGTPYSPDSLYFRAQRAGFHVFKQPYRYPDGKLIWPAKRRKIRTLKRTLSTTPGAFEIAMKLDPTAADPDAMSYEEIRDLSQADASRFDESVGHFKYTFLDPASGSTNKRVDYAGIGHVKVRWPRPAQRLKGESMEDVELPWVEVYEPRAFRLDLIAQVRLCQQIRARYGGPVIWETNGPQRMTYRRLFEAFAPEVPLIGHHTSETNKWDSHMGVQIVGSISKAGRLKVFGREHYDEVNDDEDADLYDDDDELADEMLSTEVVAGGDVRDPGVRALLYEIRDLSDPKAHNHIVHGIWFAVRHSWEQRRRGPGVPGESPRTPGDAFRDRTEMVLAAGGSYAPMTGYGGGRVIDLRRYKQGSAP